MVADTVWDVFGPDIDNYVEPFFGTGAVLFSRPGGAGKTETVNDADGLLANFWRAVQRDPDAVALHADNPVNECDLHARHLWLVGQRDRLTERLMGDAEWFDAKAAGWWCWGASCWIGGGWCTGKGPWVVGADGAIANRGSDGQGVNRKCPHLGNDGQGACDAYREHITAYMRSLADRLRRVRVCCGDWSRVCGPTPTTGMGRTAVFLDPPYADTAGRDPDCYALDCLSVAHDVRRWAIERGDDPMMRIALCGYEGEHDMPGDWLVHEWSARGGYGSQRTLTDNHNRHRERIWFSPHCITTEANHLFAETQP